MCPSPITTVKEMPMFMELLRLHRRRLEGEDSSHLTNILKAIKIISNRWVTGYLTTKSILAIQDTQAMSSNNGDVATQQDLVTKSVIREYRNNTKIVVSEFQYF